MTEVSHVLDAFADGERVDAATLAAALADPEGRAYFVDLLALRGMVAGGSLAADPTAACAHAARVRRPASHGSTALVAAAALLVSLGGGYVMGWRAADRADKRAAAQEKASSIPISLPAVDIEAPAPTHVIRFQPGVDWQESSGGH